jgi:hypothetical protein
VFYRQHRHNTAICVCDTLAAIQCCNSGGLPAASKADIDKAAAAVENAEEELKEWKAGNKQDEAQLRQAVESVVNSHQRFQVAPDLLFSGWDKGSSGRAAQDLGWGGGLPGTDPR